MTAQFSIQLTPILPNQLNDIKHKWLMLETKSNSSIFTSWYWIETWLQFINFKTSLLTVSFEDHIVGLGFLSENNFKKFGVTSSQLWLNRTGDTARDQIWNEYNDFLCVDGHEYAIRAAVLNHFEKHLPYHDELIIGVSNANIVETPHTDKLMQLATWQTPSYHTILESSYANWTDYLATLSANSRSQIKRSAKLLGGLANLNIIKAENTEQALEVLENAGKLHKIRWKNQNSGFDNPKFVEFHNNFIKNNFDKGVIDVLKIQAEGTVICYLYNFLYQGTVYFYLSGIEYAKDNRLKPGLLSHSLAISYYAKLGFKKYDFMGGEGRYKKSLCNESGTMIISNYRRKNLPFIASHLLRRIKQLVA